MNAPARRKILLALATLPLASCALVERPVELTTYAPFLVPIERHEQGAAPARPRRLVVDQPRAIAPFDGTRIAVAPTPGEIQFYKGARWRDAAPLMLQELLLQAFDDAPAPIRASASVDGGGADFVLRSDLRSLIAQYRGAPVPIVEVELAVQLVRRSDAEIVASRTFVVRTDSAGVKVPEVFAAFQAALNRLVRDVADWTVAAARGDTPKSE